MTAYEMRISDWSSYVCSSDLPARPADLRGECPQAPACGGRLPLYFAPKAYRSRRASDRRHAGKDGQPVFRLWAAVHVLTWVRISLGGKSRSRRRPQADAGGHWTTRAYAPAHTIFPTRPFYL